MIRTLVDEVWCGIYFEANGVILTKSKEKHRNLYDYPCLLIII